MTVTVPAEPFPDSAKPDLEKGGVQVYQGRVRVYPRGVRRYHNSIFSILQADQYLNVQNNNRRYLHHRLSPNISNNQMLSSKRSIYANFYLHCDYLFNFLCLSMQTISRQSKWQIRINAGRVRNISVSTITTNAKSS